MKQKYQLETLTSVHIGSGEVLNFMDGCYANGRWYHIDLNKVLEHPATDINALTSEMSHRDFRWSDYFSRHNMDAAAFSTYNILCAQSPETTEIREAIKTIEHHPYIPGSTIKGALRTALLGEILIENNEVYDKTQNELNNMINRPPRGNPRREQPARKIENHAFGKDPNHDLLRALQISDTEPIETDALEIGTAWTVTLNSNDQLVRKVDRGKEYKNFVQQIRTGQRFTFTLKIDDLLLREQEKKRLRFSDFQEQKLRSIAKACSSLASDMLPAELEFYDIYDLDRIARLYIKLEDLNNDLPENAFLLQIGWGTGYLANTATAVFANTHDPPRERWLEIQKRFKLGESRSRREHYDKREFPKTRRILYEGQRPIAPFGWVKISPLTD